MNTVLPESSAYAVDDKIEVVVSEREEHILQIIGVIDGETLWVNSTQKGVLPGGLDALKKHYSEIEALHLLDMLVMKGLLERIDNGIVILCPSCGSHEAAVLLSCPSCNSHELRRRQKIVHQACEYWGIRDDFISGGSVKCPQCEARATLDDLHNGNGFSYSDPYYECGKCGFVTNRGLYLHLCRSCGERFSVSKAVQLEQTGYKLTADLVKEPSERRKTNEPPVAPPRVKKEIKQELVQEPEPVADEAPVAEVKKVQEKEVETVVEPVEIIQEPEPVKEAKIASEQAVEPVELPPVKAPEQKNEPVKEAEAVPTTSTEAVEDTVEEPEVIEPIEEPAQVIEPVAEEPPEKEPEPVAEPEVELVVEEDTVNEPEEEPEVDEIVAEPIEEIQVEPEIEEEIDEIIIEEPEPVEEAAPIIEPSPEEPPEKEAETVAEPKEEIIVEKEVPIEPEEEVEEIPVEPEIELKEEIEVIPPEEPELEAEPIVEEALVEPEEEPEVEPEIEEEIEEIIPDEPEKEEEIEEEIEKIIPEEPEIEEEPEEESYKVLMIVEDQMFFNLIVESLGKVGAPIEVTYVEDGSQALKSLRVIYDLIIMDSELSKADPNFIIKEMEKWKIKTPMILLDNGRLGKIPKKLNTVAVLKRKQRDIRSIAKHVAKLF